ncbi:hypothetical protein GCM10020358_01000 [Amorphoplanes nipponensis]|uniref:Uncharacterized protein n=1 Tax=Actinoplanes nipponensis TaxID=135950 RepID=A0A919MG37_9ACTN|nr:hypothetical protein [Actinoplanes nipponensis]GIE48169.1 hypothetical protein Ani05nite_17030 [Actinoplanes nipponensis]
MYDPPQPSWNATPPPPPPVPGHPGPTAIAVTTRYSWLTFLLGLFKPYLAVNGQPVPARWGRTVVPVPPGQHHVHVHVPYLLPSRIGTADTVVPVHPGQVVEVEYRAPAIALLDGAIGPAPQKHRGLPAAIALVVVPLVLLLCVCGTFGVAALFGYTEADDPVARPTAVAPAPVLPDPADPAPEPTGAVPSGKPTLRSLPVRKLVGPAYAAGEKTYTMGFGGWPFAFRTPGSWGCVAGRLDLPEAKAWVCVDEGNPGSGQRLQIMLRPCPAPCGATERDRLSTEWFDPGAKARAFDESTWYVETPRDAKGRYTLDMSHFFTDPGGAGMWQVGVGAFSPPATRTAIQKVFNDVLTQTG